MVNKNFIKMNEIKNAQYFEKNSQLALQYGYLKDNLAVEQMS